MCKDKKTQCNICNILYANEPNDNVCHRIMLYMYVFLVQFTNTVFIPIEINCLNTYSD